MGPSLSDPELSRTLEPGAPGGPSMIDFELTEHDRKVVDGVRAQALIARRYARYYEHFGVERD